MFYENIVSLKVIITIKYHIDIYEKSALEQICRIFPLIDHLLLGRVQGVPKNVFFLGVGWIGVPTKTRVP